MNIPFGMMKSFNSGIPDLHTARLGKSWSANLDIRCCGVVEKTIFEGSWVQAAKKNTTFFFKALEACKSPAHHPGVSFARPKCLGLQH